ncbi:STAS domain-containing protein [Treponema zioleckii]|uniref:STAS domain-containing protein n=1 Tax=Treponema zioleckii TaxID=331680 RepID=UPI00168A925A|nr:STAS domain-containing protein [Treponema zioleckii]
MEQLQIKEKNGANYVLLELSGSLNSYNIGEFQTKVYENIQKRTMVLDLSQLASIDSTGVGVIMAGFNDGEEYGHKFYLMNPSPVARLALEETGFYEIFNFIHSVTEVD